MVDLMNNQMSTSNLLQSLPRLLTEDQFGMLAETEFDFSTYRANDRGNSQIYWLFRPEEAGGAGAAVVHYAAGGTSPMHVHTGFELAYILDGEFCTNQGNLKKGDMLLLPPGSRHDSWSETGALVLIIWQQPVVSVTP
jgi:quercetin dioxygenase-like cupin family protein